MEAYKKIIKDTKGFSGYIEAAIGVFCICMVIVLGINIFPIYLLKSKLDDYAEKALRRIELCGNTKNDTIDFLKEMAQEYGIEPEMEIICEYIKGTQNIQIDNEIVIKVKQSYTMNFGILGNYTINLFGRATGYSEVYFKY